MKKVLLGVLLCTGLAFAEPAVPAKQFNWPTTPTPFRVVTVPIDLEWRDGHPYASREDLVKVLHISPQGSSSVDLVEALSEKGWNVRRDRNGDIEAINPKGVSQGSGVNSGKKNVATKPQPTPPGKPPGVPGRPGGATGNVNNGPHLPANYNQNPYQPRQ